MEIVKRKIEDLKSYAKNARTHSGEQLVKISESIKKFGFNDPVEIDENDVIISGHARVEAAKLAGLTEVPTVKHAHLSQKDKRAYILATNRIALDSTWDGKILREEFTDLLKEHADLTISGFTPKEIEFALHSIEEFKAPLGDPEECPEIENSAVTKVNDTWLLGRHRLICGDSIATDGAFVKDDISLVLTDPPYEMKAADIQEALLISGARHFIVIGTFKQLAELYNLDVFDFHFDFILDAKVPKSFMNEKQPYYVHQNCAYFSFKNEATIFNNVFAKGIRSKNAYWPTIIDAPRNTSSDHGHAKNCTAMKEILCAFNTCDKFIYDPFGGSGTTLIACELLGRKCLMIELDQKYCDMIIRRWEKFTGQKATLEQTGEIFCG